jgi:2-deoxy-D-gluconate 3-dehydrogenase
MSDRLADVPTRPDQPFRLNGRAAWVVGAGRPLGHAIANALAEAGADVALTGLGTDQAERFQVASAANQVWSAGRRNLALELDPSDPENLDACVQQIDAEWGRLDILVNAQDLVFAMPFEETGRAEWDTTIAVNLTSVALSCQAAGKLMARDGFGRIINVVSAPGVRGVANMVAYAAAKGGVVALTRALSQEWGAQGIAVNAVHAGFYEDQAGIGDNAQYVEELRSALLPGALVKSQDIAALVVMLAADSGFISGQTIAVDGAASQRT